MSFQDVLSLLIPLVILQFALLVIGLWDLSRPERRVRGGNKIVWAVVIVLFQMVGPLAYFLIGREED